jgi:hypothetical protein
MTDHERLRDLLELTAPTDPDVTPGVRATRVVRRGRAARRRDRVLVAGAAAAVLAAAVAVPLALRGDDGPQVAAPAPEAVACPADPIDASRAQGLDGETALDQVRERSRSSDAPLGEVTSVRACATAEPGSALPAAPLVGDAAVAFADEVSALPPYAFPAECAAMTVMPDPWALLIGRADGNPVVLASSVRRCGTVVVGGVDRDAAAVIAAFERHASTPVALACPEGDRLAEGAPTGNGSFDLAGAVAGVVCYREDPWGSREYAGESGELTPEQVAVLRDDLRARSGFEPRGTCADTGPQRLVLLADAGGDRVAFVDDRCGGEFDGPAGVWRPSDAAERVIREALGGRP